MIGIITIVDDVNYAEAYVSQFVKSESNSHLYLLSDFSDILSKLKHLKSDLIKFIETPSKGLANLRNIGLSQALKDGCTSFALISQYVEIDFDQLNSLVLFQKRNPNFGIVGPMLISDTDFQPYQFAYEPLYGIVSDSIADHKKELHELEISGSDVWVISDSCLRKVGGFDPLFDSFGLDAEYANRARYFGFSIGLSNSTVFNCKKISNPFLTAEAYLLEVKSLYHNTELKVMIVGILEYILYVFKIRKLGLFPPFMSNGSAWIKASIRSLSKIKEHKRLNKLGDYYFLSR